MAQGTQAGNYTLSRLPGYFHRGLGFDKQCVAQIRTDQVKLGDFVPLKITASAFSPWFPMKSEAVSKAANKSLGLFVSGFTMKRVAKDNELITPPEK